MTTASTPKIAVGLLTEEQEFQLMQAEDARETGARLGLDVEVLFAENNAIVQIQQLFKLVHAPEEQRPAALVVESVVGEGLERVARNAAGASVGWVLLNWNVPYIERLRGEHPDVLVTSVAVDEIEIGRIQALQALALLPEGGSVLCVQGPTDTSTAQGREEGLRQGLEGSRVGVHQVLHGDWTEGSGARAVGSWLRLKSTEAFRPDLVICHNDAMAAGARAAIREHRPEWASVPLLGCDGLPSGGQRLVDSGELAATVVKPTTTGPALEVVARARNGEPSGAGLVLKPESHPPVGELAARAGRRP